MIVTEQMRTESHARARDAWLPMGWLLGSDARRRVTDATINAFDQYMSANPHGVPDDEVILRAVWRDPEVKGFIPLSWLLAGAVSWLVGLLLDYLFTETRL
jgi:hypothetical protein